MKRLASAAMVLLLAAALLAISACSPKRAEVAESVRAPQLELRDSATGQALDMAQLKGKVVFVNFWASWCMPCKEEMPSIEALHRSLLGNNTFVMVTILYKDDLKSASELMKANGYTFPLFTDHNGASAVNYSVTGVPETYLIDKKGVLRKKVIGPADWNSAEAKAYINGLLAE